jgi:hypothetical protein
VGSNTNQTCGLWAKFTFSSQWTRGFAILRPGQASEKLKIYMFVLCGWVCIMKKRIMYATYDSDAFEEGFRLFHISHRVQTRSKRCFAKIISTGALPNAAAYLPSPAATAFATSFSRSPRKTERSATEIISGTWEARREILKHTALRFDKPIVKSIVVVLSSFIRPV